MSTSQQKRFSICVWIFLIFTVYVVLGGAFVRATGSGAGCGDHWPLCNGNVIPDFSLLHTIIEYTHRTSSSISGIFGLLLFIWCFFCFQRGHLVRKACSFMLGALVLDGLLGALLVKGELVAANSSVVRAVFMSLHLVITFILLASIALTAAWSGSYFSRPQFKKQGKKLIFIIVSLIGLIVIGISGAITALGDTLFRPNYVGEGLVSDFNSASHFLKGLRIYHPILAITIGFFTVYGISRLRKQLTSPLITKLGYIVYFLFSFQLFCGFMNVVLLAPIYMQIIHLFTGDLFWIATILFFNESLIDG
jgi:cytochrome c oxidase assembly protein subunit 15